MKVLLACGSAEHLAARLFSTIYMLTGHQWISEQV